MMATIVYEARDEAGTAALGKLLADTLPDGSVVALCGTLGAGKTRLVQAIAEACGIPRASVVSPTFVLIQEYHGRRSVYHFDAYRLHDEDEFQQLGPDEYFESGGLALVEWADRVAAGLPRERLEIQIIVTGPQSRRFELQAVGSRYQELLERLRERQSRSSIEEGQ